jgi:hypothetical protein
MRSATLNNAIKHSQVQFIDFSLALGCIVLKPADPELELDRVCKKIKVVKNLADLIDLAVKNSVATR